MLTRRRLVALAAAEILAPSVFTPSLFIREGRAQAPKTAYPNKPVRIIVPVAAGGPTDIVARTVADRLSAMWGQQVFIENRSGAGNNIGIEFVARCTLRCGRARRSQGFIPWLTCWGWRIFRL